MSKSKLYAKYFVFVFFFVFKDKAYSLVGYYLRKYYYIVFASIIKFGVIISVNKI